MDKEQLATFDVDGALFGIEVMKVQEVSGENKIHHVPLAPNLVRGLVNLRGQIATAVGLREAFGKPPSTDAQMSVVCKVDGILVSLVVDAIGDVVQVERAQFESVPDHVPEAVKKYVKGIYKMEGRLLSVLDLERIGRELSPAAENNNEQVLN